MNWKKGMKWIVAVFAVVVLMSVFVGAVSAEDETAPTTPSLNADKTEIEVEGTVEFTFSADGATKYSLDYGDSKSDDSVTSPKTHQYDKAGTYIAKLTAYNGTVSSSPASVTITVTEKKNEEISSVDITLTPPESGKSTANPQSSDYTTATITWSPTLTDSKFSGGQAYTATITVTANTGYIFSSSLSVKLNDDTATPNLLEDRKSFTITKTFPATEVVQQESPTPTISEFKADKNSGTAPLTVSFSFTANNAQSFELKSATETLKSGTASPLTHTFTTAGTYTVKLVAKNGEKSAESANTVTINVESGTTLNTVNLEITAPAAGAAPATSVTGTNIVSDSVTWSPSVSSTFAADTQYKATIKVKSAAGYKFGSTPTVTVNGNPVAAAKVSVSSSKDALTITEYIIGSTGGEISSVSLTVDAPVLGEKPDTTVTTESSANYAVSSITWYKTSVDTDNEVETDKAFEGKTVYIAKIKLTAKDGYVFDSPMEKESVKVNDKAVSADITPTNNKKELTLEYTFPATEEAKKPVVTLTADPAKPVMKAGLDSVTVKFTYKITEDFDSASISFGDSSSEETITQDGGTISHTYTSASTFTVTLRAGNENGITTKTLSLPITKEKFKASFDASLLSGEAPLKVLFTDTSTGTSGKLIQRSWDFDDGTTAASQTSVTHTFEKEGTYYVQLFVSDGLNQDSARKTITVTGKNGEKKTATVDVDYEPFLIIGDVGVPSPFDLIAEFVRLIQAMLNFDNYTFSGENSES